MKIIIINRMLGVKIGGGENFDINIAKQLLLNNYDVTIIAGSKNGRLPSQLNIFKDKLLLVKTPYLRHLHYFFKSEFFILSKISAFFLELDLFIFEYAVLKRLINDTETNVFQICGLPRLALKLKNSRNFNSAKQIVSVRWPGPPSIRHKSKLNFIDVNIANGDAYNYIKNNLSNNIDFINIGVDLDFFKKNKSIKSDNFTCLFVGRIVPIKNILFLIDCIIAANKIDNKIKLRIVGDGDKNIISKILEISNYYPFIEYVGEKSGFELLEEYHSADLFCISSIYDNFPNVVLEAMASNLPVIATNVGGMTLQINHGVNGYLVDPDDLDSFKSYIIQLSNNSDLQSIFSNNARNSVSENFSWGKTIHDLIKLYTKKLKHG